MAECHDCRCHFNPPCSACERCVHIDQTVCPEDCQTCEYDHERTGPYRLLDGTWSDGVDRKRLIRSLRFNEVNPPRVSVSKVGVSRTWEAYRIAPYLSKQFPTHAEAIAYADRMARTNQGENNE